jgi:hypothetical protein
VLGRGLHQEQQEADGTLVGQMTDEVTQRGIWRQWKKLMAQGAETLSRRHANGEARRAAQ